ncbi:hypothetical protein E3N88_00920 [Mikania micrantha]|uniref:Protein kinase domain-containing protein n=1 Tax=Mikania micrantha TaxID=192012 RepID=A0A5N6PZI2_9ASTR|nr:hypothetical protein E3N88_00920 [Mikania micrantha]
MRKRLEISPWDLSEEPAGEESSSNAEVNYLGQFSHQNLVNLIGYCLEDEHRLLVYEFMPRGSLENHLFRSKSRGECKKREQRVTAKATEKLKIMKTLEMTRRL